MTLGVSVARRGVLWAEHHRRQIAVFERLAEEHRERLGRLIDLGAERR